MKSHRKLTARAQIVAEFGEPLIAKLDGLACEPTNIVNATLECNDLVEYSASIRSGDSIVTAYYYITSEEHQLEDLSSAAWEIDGYDAV
jgi:hypothetical protein